MPLYGEVARKYNRERAARIRAAYLADKKCAKCGSVEFLQVHHIDPSTKIDHKVWTWAEARRMAELAKCETLCEPCHRELHAAMWRLPLVHGTRSGYMEKGCRCKECISAASLYRNEQRYRTGTRFPRSSAAEHRAGIAET